MPFLQYPVNSPGGRLLPGTLAMRLFAAAICILAAIEAISARQPFIALVGLLLSVGIALTGPLFVERHGLRGELDLRGTWHAGAARWLLMVVAFVGLAVGVLDLSDLAETDEVVIYPIVQLGLPVTAFLAAVTVGTMAMLSAPAQSAARPWRTESLWRACLALSAYGAVALGLAELAEHGVPDNETVYLAAVGAIGLAIFGFFRRGTTVGTALDATDLRLTGPQTLGIRVDGRARWVDFLEDCMSLGQRRNILAATLSASGIGPGQNLLDIGCGTGELVAEAAQIISAGGRMRDGYALGVDATPAMIELARARAEQDGILARFEVAVAEHLPLPDGVIDCVTSSFFFHHLPSAVKAEALREMWRVLRPGGRLVITDYGRPQGLLGYVASFPMRFNFHEHVRGQLNGEVEAVIAATGIGRPRIARSFLGYINVLVLEKPCG